MRLVVRITHSDSLRIRVRDGVEAPESVAPTPPAPAPAQVTRRHDFGKAPAAELLKPVKRGTIRANILDVCSMPVRVEKLLERCEISRDNLRAHLVAIHREHGIGYKIEDGVLTALYPRGV